MRSKASIGEYLAFLSTKFDVDVDQFFRALVSAEEKKKAACGELLIECRSKNRDKIVVMITKGSRAIAQFPVPRMFLLEQKNPIKPFIGNGLAHRCSARKNVNPASLRIKDLRNGMKKVSLTARVLEIPKPTLVFTRFGNYASVANALITDDTGTIKLCLWNEQIDSVSIGDTIQIENAHMSTFRGESQLRIGKKGKLVNTVQLSPQPEVVHNS